jgi:hypothetical protein
MFQSYACYRVYWQSNGLLVVRVSKRVVFMKYSILTFLFLYISVDSNYAYANHPGYNCTIDEKMHCEEGNEPEANLSGSDSEPDSGQVNDGGDGEETPE